METPLSPSVPPGDYRALLAESFRRLKTGDKKFSHRFVNQRMGAHSSGWFSDILAGRQKLRARHVAPLATLLKLAHAEKDLLRALVALESAVSAEEKSAAYTKWTEARGLPRSEVARAQFKYFERWYYPVLRELLSLAPFDRNYAALGASLRPALSEPKTRAAVRLLVRLGLTHPDAPGPTLVKQASQTPHWRKLMDTLMDLARPALTDFGKAERDFSALTLTLSPESLREAGEEIAALRRRLLTLSERDAGRNRVYQCLFQVFPVSRTVEKNDA